MKPLVLLSGGLATRMRPLTEKMPKAMLEIAGEPFIHHQLSLLQKKGITHVIICAGYLGERIQQFVGDGVRYNLQIDYSFDGDKLLGTGGAIKKAEKFLPESFFILYGDSYLDVDYAEIAYAFDSSHKRGLMTVYKNENKWDSSNVEYKDKEIIKYSKSDKSEDMRHIDYGLCILRKEVLRDIESGTEFDMASMYEKLAQDRQLIGYEVFNRFYEIGSREGMEELDALLQRRK